MGSTEELSSFALMQQNKQRWEQTNKSFALVDTDHNDAVTLLELRINSSANSSADAQENEVEDHLSARFLAADFDGTGMLSPKEYHCFLHPTEDPRVLPVATMSQIASLDEDKSGGLNLTEFLTFFQNDQMFSKSDTEEDFNLHDANRDGILS